MQRQRGAGIAGVRRGGPSSISKIEDTTAKRRLVFLCLGALCFIGMIIWVSDGDMTTSNTSSHHSTTSTRGKATTGEAASKVPYANPGKLLNEYQQLQLALRKVQRNVDRLRQQINNEPQAPKSDVYTNGKGRGAGNAGGAIGTDGTTNISGTTAGDKGLMVDPRAHETIFVSVASFRDWECPNTVRDMYKTAGHPERLFLGIIEQNDPDDPSCIPVEYEQPDCMESAEFCPRDNIRIRRVRPHEAKGPTFGRWVAMMMYRDEKYFMMIDSHNRFLVNWDVKLINMYSLIPSRKGVMSHYPNSWLNKSNVESEGSLMVMCYAHFLPDLGYMRLGARVLPRSIRPRLQPYAAAGFLFADGSIVREVPFDPYLDFVFDGEEILYSIRMWTHGWDIYSPTESVLFHYYLRSGAPRVWSVKNLDWGKAQKISQQRVQYILGVTYPNSTLRLVPFETKEERIKKELDVYGLGKERTIDDYWRFARVDPIARKSDHSFCDSIPNQHR